VKVRDYCRGCLEDLARRVVALSGGNEEILANALGLVADLFGPNRSPTAISNRLLKEVRQRSGVEDPFADLKKTEAEKATTAARRLKGAFPPTLEGALQSAAFGNGGDFFMEHDYHLEGYQFLCDVDKIAAQVYVSSKILILGDNLGDFVFDAPLVDLLAKMGKQVFYAIKERPVQNDMSLADLGLFNPRLMNGAIVSTGTDEVGLRREEMTGIVKECWEDGSCVIAKGMGNFESISEYDRERPVIYLMNVKCGSVAEAVGHKVGNYIGMAGGDHG
jgi:damage-control phosphatase, subfamily I